MILPVVVHFLAACALLQTASGSAIHVGEYENLGIHGGDKVSIDKVPFMVALHRSYDNVTYKPHCGGAIVHRRFVLTAAHCIISRSKSENVMSRSVLIGTDHLGNGILIQVEKPVCHEKFHRNKNKGLTNDICLLKLRNPIEFVKQKVAPVQLPDSKDFELEEGTLVKVTGWGSTEFADDVDTLYQATLPMVSQKRCLQSYVSLDFNSLPVNTVCAGLEGLDACWGDSGGPLTYNNVQIGIVSFGFGCGKEPGVYTNVAKYLDWINRTIKNDL